MRRRQFLGLASGAAAAAGIGVPLVSGLRGAGLQGPTSTGGQLTSRIPLPTPYQLPLVIPPILQPVRREADADHYEIVQKAARVEILPGVQTEIWGYNGIFPGPTIVSRSGRATVVRHRNELPVPVVVHLHGGRTPAADDGYPTDLLNPVGGVGEHHQHDTADVRTGQREYRYPLQQRASTLWYHDHRMDFTGASVWRGLAGFHLVHDAEDDA
ncbi:MAG TPA: multicopper oxidase domain-containing protein, partial [Kribbella sp.]